MIIWKLDEQKAIDFKDNKINTLFCLNNSVLNRIKNNSETCFYTDLLLSESKKSMIINCADDLVAYIKNNEFKYIENHVMKNLIVYDESFINDKTNLECIVTDLIKSIEISLDKSLTCDYEKIADIPKLLKYIKLEFDKEVNDYEFVDAFVDLYDKDNKYNILILFNLFEYMDTEAIAYLMEKINLYDITVVLISSKIEVEIIFNSNMYFIDRYNQLQENELDIIIENDGGNTDKKIEYMIEYDYTQYFNIFE